jgi:hypothetical protein
MNGRTLPGLTCTLTSHLSAPVKKPLGCADRLVRFIAGVPTIAKGL